MLLISSKALLLPGYVIMKSLPIWNAQGNVVYFVIVTYMYKYNKSLKWEGPLPPPLSSRRVSSRFKNTDHATYSLRWMPNMKNHLWVLILVKTVFCFWLFDGEGNYYVFMSQYESDPYLFGKHQIKIFILISHCFVKFQTLHNHTL